MLTQKNVCILIVAALLVISLAANIWMYIFSYDIYLQEPEQVYIMESGILRNNLTFRDGNDLEFAYDFSHADYAVLLSKYGIGTIAGSGSEFDRAMRLMDEFSSRLTHRSRDDVTDMGALSLLEYSLDNPKNGINCRNKAQILNEMCLALGIYSRKVWLIPYSPYDQDCHVVNEIWDTTWDKWIMLDITTNEYWVDEHGTPLSVLEIRQKGAMREFCTPVKPGDRLDDLQVLQERYIGHFLYIMKNMVGMKYFDTYTAGESETVYFLLPENFEIDYDRFVSVKACLRSPMD